MIVYIGSEYDESFTKTIEYFRNKHKGYYPSAIVCFNDDQAFAVIKALNVLNIKIRDGISNVGNDDIRFSKYFSIPLPTVRAPLNEMGIQAAKILIRNIKSRKVLPDERVIFKNELIVRESTR